MPQTGWASILRLENGWTGGHYSLLRMLLGLYLLQHFARGAWGAGALSARAPLVAGCVLSCLIVAGAWDRAAALGALILWLWLHRPVSLAAGLALFPVSFVLAAHALTPGAPCGSWKARGRPDPGGDWHLPAEMFAVGWVLLGALYACAGILARRSGTLPQACAYGLILFAPLALFSRLRPWVWLAMLVLQAALLAAIREPVLPGGILLMQLWAFDPSWIPARWAGEPEVLFFDGHCGLCHGLVRFTMAEDPHGLAFRYAALEGDAFRRWISEEERKRLPDSIVLRTTGGSLLVKSDAVLRASARLGGVWRLLSAVGSLVPRGLLDAGYDTIARARYPIMGRRAEACPVVPAALRTRFLD